MWVVWVVCCLGVFAVRRLEIDLAVINIVSAILVGIAGGLFVIWWTFRSGLPSWIRLLLPVALCVGASVFYSRYEIVGTSGSLVPQFVRRGSLLPDEQLDVGTIAPTADQPVDLLTTSEFDFPRFLGANADSRVTNVQLDPDWETNPPQQLWSREIGAGWSAFAAVNGYAVTLEQRGPWELITCYRVGDGQPVWSHRVESRHATVMGFVGPRSTPTIAEGLVFAMGANGIFRCLNSDGSEKWVRDLFKDYGMSMEEAGKAVAWGRANSPLVVRQHVVIPIGGIRGGECVGLIAMDRETGETVWEGGRYQASYASPVLLNIDGVEQIVSVNENFVSGHDKDTGETLWEHPWEGRSDMNANVSQPMAVDESHLWLSKGYGKGSELVELTHDDNGLWDVEVVWAERVMKTKFSNVAFSDGYAYGLDDGILSCVEVDTGQRMWKRGRYQYGQILLVGDYLLVMSEEGDLALVETNPDEYRELHRIKALEGQTWNTMCLYGDKLLVRNSEQAACYQLTLLEESNPTASTTP